MERGIKAEVAGERWGRNWRAVGCGGGIGKGRAVACAGFNPAADRGALQGSVFGGRVESHHLRKVEAVRVPAQRQSQGAGVGALHRLGSAGEGGISLR